MENAEQQTPQTESEVQPKKPDLRVVDNAEIKDIVGVNIDWNKVANSGIRISLYQKDNETIEDFKKRVGYTDIQGKMVVILGEYGTDDFPLVKLENTAIETCHGDVGQAVLEIAKTRHKFFQKYNIHALGEEITANTIKKSENLSLDGKEYIDYGIDLIDEDGGVSFVITDVINDMYKSGLASKAQTEEGLTEFIRISNDNREEYARSLPVDRYNSVRVLEEQMDEPFSLYDDTDEYMAIEKALTTLRDVGSEKCIMPVIDLIQRGDAGHIYEACQTLSAAAPEKTSKILMAKLKTGSLYEKSLAEKLLLNLELGKIGISAEGVNYLNQTYDLGIFNKKGAFVQRLTNEGEIGVFDEESDLMVYFPLELDRHDDGRKIRAKIHRFAYETIFIPKPDETSEEKKERERILKEFREKFSDTYLSDFEEKTGLVFNSFSFHEQGWFLEYMGNISQGDKAKVYDFLREYGYDGLRTFLSAGYGVESMDQIFEFAELNPGGAKEVFREYAKTIDLADECLFSYEDITDKEKNLIFEGIIRRAKEVLVGSLPFEKRISIFRKHGRENPFGAFGINPANALRVYQTYLKAYFDIEEGREELDKIVEKLKPNRNEVLYLCDLYASKNPDLASIPSTFRELLTLKEALDENKSDDSVRRTRDVFYKEYQEMNTKASETTGDTIREKARLFNFIDSLNLQKGTILDAGCGDGFRMTEPLNRFLKRRGLGYKIIGLDSLQSDHKSNAGVEYKKGDITNMGGNIENSSIDLVINNWSVINDLLERDEQNKALREYARVLKREGYLYLDVPLLEGGEGSYEEEAKKYHESHPDTPYGTLDVHFDGSKEKKSKRFYIYPRLELIDFLRENGFQIKNMSIGIGEEFIKEKLPERNSKHDPNIRSAWRTRSGKPRVTIIAQKISEAPSSLASRLGYPTHPLQA